MKIIDSLMKTISPPVQTASSKPMETAEKGTSLLTDTTTESGKIISELKAQGYDISSDEADRIAEFIESTDGTESEKVKTVKAALDKGLPLTMKSLQSIQAALFTVTLPQELQTLMEAMSAEISTDRVNLLRGLAQLAFAEKSGTVVSVNPEHPLTEVLAKNVGALTEQVMGTTVSDGAATEDKIITWLLNALEQVAIMSDALGEAHMDSEKLTTIKGNVQPSQRANSPQGHPDKNVEHIQDEYVALSNEYPENIKNENSAFSGESENVSNIMTAVEQLVSAMDKNEGMDSVPSEAFVQGMTLLMKEITPKIAAVKVEFESLRKSVTADLNAVRLELNKPVALDKGKVVEQLDQAIDKLDKAILKSDIPLYTSMKAEKQLLTWSSELQAARDLMAGGRNAEASAIVERVAKGVEEIKFQPAKLKMIHRTIQQAAMGDELRERSLQQRIQQQVGRILEPIQTPRDVLEAFKALGLTHESEVVSALGQSGKKLKDDWLPQENLKEMLMKLAADTQEKLTTVTGAEKTLNNLTGQQLLSRPEAKPQGQTLFFSLPMEVANRVEDLKIYVQSRKDKGKVDWENCTFYFAVHTEKYGDVGIRFAAARKSVSIQVKCDNQALRDAVSPMVEDFKQTMWETGYKIAGISYSPLKEHKATESRAEEAAMPEQDGKGLNIKV